MADVRNVLESRIKVRDLNRDRFDLIERGDFHLPIFLKPCRMKILMVVDGSPGSFVNVTFGRLYFSLSAVVDLLENSPDWWIKYDLTKVHRQTDPLGAADMEGFRFTQSGFDINAYDQVWFFGARTNVNDTLRLSDAELEIVARWMDERQGGVFAVGDHADLGASLCGRIPRVSTMRKWAASQSPPNNFGPGRHDTLRRGHDSFYNFHDESDDIPMPIRVKRYPLWSVSPFKRRWAPHPVLCGKDGVIDILPDHPHEGEVIEPSSPTAQFSFGNYLNKPEYPEISGHREMPAIIAWASVTGDHTEGRSGQPGTDRNKGPADAKEFGAIGAYDGHQGDVGRVIVDSTWHHWFDVNLIGRPRTGDLVDPVPDDDPKAFGFEYSAAGRTHYARIKEYFLNTAKWLGSPTKQRCMLFRALHGIVLRYPLAEQLSPKMAIWELGGVARDAIGRRAGRCTMFDWILAEFPVWREFLPFDPRQIPEKIPDFTGPNWEAFETYVLGGVTREILKHTEATADSKEPLDERKAAAALAKGLASGAKAYFEDYKASLEQSARSLRSLESLTRASFDSKAFGH